jgi:hypothetical protein
MSATEKEARRLEAARRYPAIAAGHNSPEAFCLMWYRCECGHKERIWNSRDGVTPFCMACPSCNKPAMQHVDWHLDKYSPDHKPYIGQRMWIAMTWEMALKIATRNVARAGLERSDKQIEALASEYWMDGQSPNLAIHGYADDYL